MKRSISAFIFGLIASVFCLYWGFLFGVLGETTGGIISAIGGEGLNITNIVSILGWVCFGGAIVGIIGASNCFKYAKRGGILLAISTVLCGALLVYVLIQILSASSGQMLISSIIICLLPIAFLIVATICAFKGKPYVPKVPYGYPPYQQPPYGYPPQGNYQQQPYAQYPQQPMQQGQSAQPQQPANQPQPAPAQPEQQNQSQQPVNKNENNGDK